MEDYNNSYEGANQNQFSLPTQEKKSNKKIWLLVLIPISILIIGLLVFFILNQSQKIISDNEITQGKNIQLKENEEVSFILNSEEHTLKVDSITTNSVTLTIQSEKTTLTLKIGEEANVDIDKDGIEDIYIRLEKIEGDTPVFAIKKLSLDESGNILEETNSTENKNVSEEINNSNNLNPCIEQGGVLCNGDTEQCPSGSTKMGDDFCCFEKCYDTSKTCSELGGELVDNWNNCDGERVGSSDTLQKGVTDVCCIGEYIDKNSEVQCGSKGGVICTTGCAGESIYVTEVVSPKSCCEGGCLSEDMKGCGLARTLYSRSNNEILKSGHSYVIVNNVPLANNCISACSIAFDNFVENEVNGSNYAQGRCYNDVNDNLKEYVSDNEVTKTCENQGGISCSNGQKCSEWITSPDKRNCCSSCQSNSVTAAEPLLCENITFASYTGNFEGGSQWLTIRYAESEHASPWGRVYEEGWDDYQKGAFGLRGVIVYSPDNLLVESDYQGGTLTLTCDGNEVDVLIPSFTDIGEEGFIDENNVFFETGFYVEIDGSTYYDLGLTKPAKLK